MKTLILAAALVALSAPLAFAETPLKHTVADAAAVPDAVKTYVRQNAGDPILYGSGVQVGESVRQLDAGEVWRTIPDYPQYRWSNLGGQLVIIDNATNKVAAVY